MNFQHPITALSVIVVLISGRPASAFDSGSDGSLGPLAPTTDLTLVVPDAGIFNYETINIPNGVTVTFAKNSANTPVIILASGDVTIAGTLSVDGGDGQDVGPTQAATDGAPGVGGPGAADGGRGGIYISSGLEKGGVGRGLGGGGSGRFVGNAQRTGPCGGAGGGFGGRGADAADVICRNIAGVRGGVAYGTNTLSQLLAGSGGGGGSGGSSLFGSGGGGGGGALLLASSGTVTIADTGVISADGGDSGSLTGLGFGGSGGGGSGGAIRIVATTIAGEGTIRALGGSAGSAPNCALCPGSPGGIGRIRLEAENLLRLSNTNPAYSFSPPTPLFYSNIPTLRVVRIGGVDVPLAPTGDQDVVLPGAVLNPVNIDLETTGIPVGTIVQVVAKRIRGGLVVVNSSVVGTVANGTATASIDLPNGVSVIEAAATVTVTASLGNALRNFAQGEQVDRIELATASGQGSTTTLITVSGKRYTWPSSALSLN